jgi:glycosyltransferase involved in cell wall biosynthesis
LHQLVRRRRLEDVVSFIAPASPMDVVASAAQYDVGVICYRADSLNLASTVPNKLMDYLGAGLALAVSDLPGPRSVLENTGAVLFIDPSSPETIARDIVGLLEDPESIAKMKHAALKAATAYQWKVQADKLVAVYSELLDSRV